MPVDLLHPGVDGFVRLAPGQLFMVDEFTVPRYRRQGITRQMAYAMNPWRVLWSTRFFFSPDTAGLAGVAGPVAGSIVGLATGVTMPADSRYRVDARRIPFTPSWFWEVIDTSRNTIVENSLALSRSIYPSPAEALAAGQDYLGGVLRMAPAKPALAQRAA